MNGNEVKLNSVWYIKDTFGLLSQILLGFEKIMCISMFDIIILSRNE